MTAPGRHIDDVIAEKQAEYEALEEETAVPMSLGQIAAKQAKKAAVLRELEELKRKRNGSRAWWGPAIPGHPWWEGQPFHSGFKFEARTEADALRQAEDAYRLIFPRVDVEVAKDQDDMRAALADFLARKSNVLKICLVE